MCTDLIDKKGYAKPPSQSTQCDGQVSGDSLKHQHALTYKSKAGEKAYKKENNQWIGKCDGKRRYEVMEIGTLIGGYRPDGLYRIAAERINAKCQQKNASEKLQVKDVLVDPQFSGECNISLGMFVMSKEFLKKIVSESISRNQYSLIRDVLQAKKNEYTICGYEHKGYFSKIDSLLNFYNANLELLKPENRNALFKKDFPVYTKIGDNGPTKYGLESDISNSLIADGCIIEGTVENCVLFRGVKIGKDTVIKNSVILQGTEIGEGCQVSSVITDKNVKISNGKVLTGSDTYPLFIGKNAQI